MLTPDQAALDFIRTLEEGKYHYKLVTTIRDLAIDSTFTHQQDNNFQVAFTLLPDQHNKGVDLDYFLKRPFALITEGMQLFINHYKVTNCSRSLNEEAPCNYKISISSFKGDADPTMWQQAKLKAYIRYNPEKFSAETSGLNFDLKTHDKDNGFFNAVKFNIHGTDLIFYHELIKNDLGYFVVAHNGEIDFEKFQSIVTATITAYGFLNGFFMLDTIYYLSRKEIKGKAKMTFYYENHRESINSKRPILDSGNYPDIPRQERELSSSQFEKLVNLLFDDTEYRRSAYLLIEAATLNGCAQASLGAVALETITKKIQEAQAAEKIIPDNKAFKGIVFKFNKILKEFADQLSKEQSTVLSNKLNQLNNKPNASKLTGAFEKLGIPLSKEEKECINSRNLFLHGNLPAIKDSQMDDKELLTVFANRLLMLSSMLLLKLSGYEGYLIDRGMTEIVKWRIIMKGQRAPGGNFLRNISKVPEIYTP